MCTNMHRNTHSYTHITSDVLLKSQAQYYTICYTKKHTRLSTSSSYWKCCVLTSIIPIPSNIYTHSADHILCLKWQQGAELLFTLAIARVFVWLHAYCAVIEHSDPDSKGGLLTNKLHWEKTQALCGVDAIFRSYTCSLYVCVGADKMKACLMLSGYPLDILAVWEPVTWKRHTLWLWRQHPQKVSIKTCDHGINVIMHFKLSWYKI